MVLVDYSDSESEKSCRETIACVGAEVNQPIPWTSSPKRKRSPEDDGSNVNAKKSRLPALPASLHTLYATNVRSSTKDDPSLHGGRQRQVPHVEGNWPSHVYLEWFPCRRDLLKLEACIKQAKHAIEVDPSNGDKPQIFSLLRSDLGVQLPLHISLSSPLILTTTMKDEFLTTLQLALVKSGVSAFSIRPTSLDWVSNYDRSRYFLILNLARPTHNELSRLLQQSNITCQSYQLPTLYENTSAVGVKSLSKSATIEDDPAYEDQDGSGKFHISIAWTLHTPSEAAKKTTQSLALQDLDLPPLDIDGVRIKIGNIITNHKLPF